MENFLISKQNKIITPKDITAPVNDMKNPIDKKVPLTKETTKTRTKLINTASFTPSSYKVTKMTMLAKPSLIPGIVKDGIKDSAIAITMVAARRTPIICAYNQVYIVIEGDSNYDARI